jgi:transcription elongation factor Elf1
VCDFCGIAFKAKSDLGMHVKRHMGDKRFECKVCGKRFFESTDLKDHLDTHETVSRHECVHCKEKFLTRPRMWHHIKVKHKDPKKPIQKVTHGDKDDQEEEENNETEIEDENASHKSFDQIKIEPDSCTDDDEKESLSNKRNKAKKDLNNVKVKKVKLNFSKK